MPASTHVAPISVEPPRGAAVHPHSGEGVSETRAAEASAVRCAASPASEAPPSTPQPPSVAQTASNAAPAHWDALAVAPPHANGPCALGAHEIALARPSSCSLDANCAPS